jgi:hypothetical protein
MIFFYLTTKKLNIEQRQKRIEKKKWDSKFNKMVKSINEFMNLYPDSNISIIIKDDNINGNTNKQQNTNEHTNENTNINENTNEQNNKQPKHDIMDDFEIDAYRFYNLDLRHLNDEHLINHFKVYGHKENRIWNNKILNDFHINYPELNLAIYKYKNNDLSHMNENELKIHYYFFGRYEKDRTINLKQLNVVIQFFLICI